MDKRKPQIMILGTFHMAGSSDVFQFDIDNIKSEKRQKELREVIDKIKKFNPTKVAVERQSKFNDNLNVEFERYIRDENINGVNEIKQIAFPVARELGHSKIYGIDWMERGAATCPAGEVYEYAKEKEPKLFNSINQEDNRITTGRDMTILEIYRSLNHEERLKEVHEKYINMARIGIDDNYKGMGWLTWWYQRNLIIFANLSKLIESDVEKIFLLIGSSHVGILSNFIKESQLFELIDIFDYL
ncbi:hypothetical protein J2Z44_002638 [Clostridium punense]|uniref:TraB family protein n=1 Tax=Clostridium punense TaxID=1054297 RepID=A0ABS4K4V4_9CLOT|nr:MULTISPECIES: DUF5694 domain-containing protein [Clostridium]EQB86099.1 hypothetical protein M918_15970 [Clostridium sp. BL8]MBP2022813.1 hypothetical protein [Clostridium punense]